MELQTQSTLLQSALSKQLQSVGDNPALKQAIGQSFGTQQSGSPSTFNAILKNAFSEVTESQQKAEDLSRKALVGEASLTELVPAVLNAESTLRTVTTLRDRVTEAYREILRTPI